MVKVFLRNKVASSILACMLVMTTANFACPSGASAWLDTIGKYLPTALQLAKAIIPLISLFGAGADQSDQDAVTKIGNEAVNDFELLQKAYNDYKANPSPDTKTTIENALASVTTNLPQLLDAAHIKNATLLAKVTAAVNMVLTVADIMIAQIPVENPQLAARKAKAKSVQKLSPEELKMKWNVDVCTSNSKCEALVQ